MAKIYKYNSGYAVRILRQQNKMFDTDFARKGSYIGDKRVNDLLSGNPSSVRTFCKVLDSMGYKLLAVPSDFDPEYDGKYRLIQIVEV